MTGGWRTGRTGFARQLFVADVVGTPPTDTREVAHDASRALPRAVARRMSAGSTGPRSDGGSTSGADVCVFCRRRRPRTASAIPVRPRLVPNGALHRKSDDTHRTRLQLLDSRS